MYSQLVSELSLKIDKYEQALDMADNQGRTFVRTPLVQSLRLDTKGFNSDLKGLDTILKAALKPIQMPIELEMKVVGDKAVITQAEAIAVAMKKGEVAALDLQKVLSSLHTNPLEMSIGGADKFKDIGADLKRLGASLEADAKLGEVFNQRLQKMEALLDGVGAKGAAAAHSLDEGGKAGGSWAKGLGSVNEIGGTVGKTLSGIMGTVASFAAGQLIVSQLSGAFQVLKSSTLDYNITVERTGVALTAMLGGNQKAANTLLSQLQTFAERTPFNFDELTSLAPQLLAAKIAAKDVIPTLTALGDAASASGKGADGIRNMSSDLLSLSARGKVTGQDIKNFGNNGVNIVTLLAKAYKDVLPAGAKESEMAMRSLITKGMIPAEQGIKAITAGIENSNFGGQMAKQSKTFEGAMSNIGDSLKHALGEKAFGASFGYITKEAQKFQNFVSSPAFMKWADDMGPKVLVATQTIGTFFKNGFELGGKFYNVMVDVAGAAWSMGETIAKGISYGVEVGKASLPVLEAAAAGVALSFARSGAMATWAFVQTLPAAMASAVGSLGAFATAAKTAQVSWAYVPAVVLAGVVAVTDGFSWLVDKSYDLLDKVPGLSKTWLKNDRQGWEEYKKSYSDGFDAIKEVAQQKIGDIAGAFLPDMSKYKVDTAAIEKMFAGASGAAGNAQVPAMPHFDAGDFMSGGAKVAQHQAKLQDELAKIDEKMARNAEDTTKRQLDALKRLADGIQGIFGSIQSDLAKYGVFNSPLDGFIQKIQDTLAIGKSAQDVVDRGLKTVGDFWDKADTARQNAQTMRDAASTIPCAQEPALELQKRVFEPANETRQGA